MRFLSDPFHPRSQFCWWFCFPAPTYSHQKAMRIISLQGRDSDRDHNLSMVVHTTSVRKGTWTEEEDLLLKKFVEEHGEGKWRHVPSKAGLNRCRKSCRLRWLNYLRPNIKRGEFSIDEVDLLIRLHRLLGNRWSLIAGRIPGRTANDVKNYWNSHLSKKLLSDHKNISSLAKHHPIPHISAMKNSEWFNSLSSSQSSFNNQRADHKDDEKTKGEGEGGQSCVWSNIELDATQNDTSMRTEDKSMVMDDGDLFMGFEDLIPDIWGVLGQ